MLKKILSLFLSLLLISSLTACGGGSNANLKAQIQNLETLADTVTFGTDMVTKEPIEWYVLEDDGSKALLLSKYLLEECGYNDEEKDITWENCTLRKWLNSDFMKQTFSKKEQNSILTTDVVNNDNAKYGTKGGNNTKDKIFLLSIDEFKKYFPKGSKGIKNRNRNDGPVYWWLRSPGEYQHDAASVDSNDIASINESGYSVLYEIGVRPALWVEY